MPGGLFDPRTATVGTAPFGASAQGFDLSARQCLIHVVQPSNGARYGPVNEGQRARIVRMQPSPSAAPYPAFGTLHQPRTLGVTLDIAADRVEVLTAFHRKRLETALVHVPFAFTAMRRVGVVAVGILIVVLPDWGTDWLSDDQAQRVNVMTQELLEAGIRAGDTEVVRNLQSMTVTGIFEPGWIEDDNSETRNGRLFGWSSRTILSADFFQRDRPSQMRTLLHESYHAGTEDWTEDKAYNYGGDKFAKLKKRFPNLGK